MKKSITFELIKSLVQRFPNNSELGQEIKNLIYELDKKNKLQEIIDEVYNKYTNKYLGYEDVPNKDLFLHEIKTNPEFSEKWGLKIEERELDIVERVKLGNFEFGECVDDSKCDEQNIPNKKITVLYNNEKFEFYG